VTPFSTPHNPVTDFSWVPVFGSFPWLSAIPLFTQVNLAITGDEGCQVTMRMSFFGRGSQIWLCWISTGLKNMLTVVMQESPIAHRPWRVIRSGVTNNRRGLSRKSALCSATAQRGIVSCKSDTGSTRRQKRKNAAELVIDAHLFSEEVIRALIDEWIVPSNVERMISSISNPSSTPKG
jgi:hypothetical protein